MIGASWRASRARRMTPSTTAGTSSALRSENDWIPSSASMSTVVRPSGTCAGLLSPSVPRIEMTAGKPSPYGRTSEPIAFSELPSPEHCSSTSGIPPAARKPAA